MSNERSLFSSIKHYFSGNLLTTIAGFISFPILTRLLSQADYGVYSILQASQLIVEALLKMGSQFSIRRFYANEFYELSDTEKSIFVTNYAKVPILFSFFICLILSASIVVYSLIYNESYYWLLLVVLAVQTSVVLSILRSFMQASYQSKSDTILNVLQKYSYLLLVLPIVLWVSRDYVGVYIATVVSVCIVTVYSIYLNRSWLFGFAWNFDFSIIKRSLQYSLPLLLVELSALSLSYIDRIMLTYLGVSLDEVGLYSIGFGLGSVLFMLILKTLQPSILPNVVILHDKEGVGNSVIALKNSYDLLIVALSLLLVGIFANCYEFLMIMSGADKVGASYIFFAASGLYFLRIIFVFLFYGFELSKNTKSVFYTEVFIAVINIVFNLLLIPVFGIWGAVYASFLSLLIGGLFKYFWLPGIYRISLLSGVYVKVIFPFSVVYCLGHFLVLEQMVNHDVIRFFCSGVWFLVCALPFFKKLKSMFFVVFTR